MKQKSSSRSIRIIYWITQGTFCLFSGVAMFAAGFALVLIIGLLDSTQLHMGMPLQANVKEVSEVVLNNQVVEVELKEMTGKIHFIDTPIFIGRIFGATMLIALGLTFYGFLTFRKFITNVYYGQFFEKSNIYLLKRISYVLLALWMYTVIFTTTQYFVLLKKLNFETVDFTVDFNSFSGLLLSALFIWVLSHIFMKGAELKEENELTV